MVNVVAVRSKHIPSVSFTELIIVTCNINISVCIRKSFLLLVLCLLSPPGWAGLAAGEAVPVLQQLHRALPREPAPHPHLQTPAAVGFSNLDIRHHPAVAFKYYVCAELNNCFQVRKFSSIKAQS